eukprot:CAMPEP_0194219410 /NCGR_PEP_ID=MMETSP0156-20130528/25906_1 /TAXON_ID=33649 /ORGANISM="Thalassionema nitzschioides, Strain L26-B" /LENGTH=804 /DNA_ID=CAMNT_0038949063 /DNA_START=244 /DNA_END=2655 /DNA_ORIENTATION=+
MTEILVARDPCEIPYSSGSNEENTTVCVTDCSDSNEECKNKKACSKAEKLQSPERDQDEDFAAFSSKAETVALNATSAEKTTSLDSETKECKEVRDNLASTSNGQTSVEAERNDNEKLNKRYVTPKDFELLKVIGMGAFGKVLQVRNKHSGKIVAMKVISKRLINKGSGYIENVLAEKNILTKIQHPFIVNMHCSFQTKEKLFIIMDFLAGGELFLRLGREGIFLENTAAFYLGEIILALDHLHSKGILHRDLKPENILLCSDGHVCITDFGLARDLSRETGFGGFQTEEDESRARTVCGTQEYMSPEMLSRQGYGRASDWWSLGCIAYEMLSGRPPFETIKGKGSKDLFRRIMSEKVKMPDGSSAAACKLLKGLLNRNATQRWGASRSTMFEVGGVAGLKSVAFFQHLDWEKLELKQLEPPDKKPVENDEDLRHFYDEFKQMPLPRSVTEMSMDAFLPQRVQSGAFRGFSFVHDDFVLPVRRNSELQRYWESYDEDGLSLSETASSKIELGEEKAAQDIPPKKKRPPRKRKKKIKAANNQLSPLPSENGEKAQIETPSPIVNGEGDISESVSIEKQNTDAVTNAAQTKLAKGTENKPKVSKPTVGSKPKVTVPKEETWAEVKSSTRKKQALPLQPQKAQPVTNVTSWNYQHNGPTDRNQKPQGAQVQRNPYLQAQSKETTTYRPAAGSWAAMAHQQQTPKSKPWPTQQNQIPASSARPQRQTIPEVPPSPSSDWRRHNLVRNISSSSFLDTGSTPITPRLMSQHTTSRPDLSNFPSPPTSNGNNFPSHGKRSVVATAKPLGAW